MRFFRAMFLLILTNLAVLAVGAVVVFALAYFGIDLAAIVSAGSWQTLAIYAAIYGFGGAFFSLAISRWIAKKSYGVRLFAGPGIPAGRLSGKEALVADTVARLAQAHGITMPEVGVYDAAEPNAFATGPSANRALVAVSTGLLDRMSPAEIEGVVAHEMAHVLNGDMLTMTLIQGVMNAFVIVFANLIVWAVRVALSRGEREGLGMLASHVVYFVLQIALGVLASVVVMAFSRWREFGADAGAAKFVGADKMIAGLRKLKEIVAKQGEPTERSAPASMGISGKQGGLLSLFASHPPLEERIARLEKNYFIR